GGFLAGGYATVGGQRDFALARFDSVGRLDPTFGNGGKVVLDLGGDDVLHGLAAQPDGSIIAVGGSSRGGDDIVVGRFTASGALDGSFGQGGVFRLDVAGGLDEAHAVALQPDGKIVVAGVATLSHAGGANQDMALLRLTPAGRLDTGFGSGGVVLLDFGQGDDAANSLLLQDDGKVVVGGSA